MENKKYYLEVQNLEKIPRGSEKEAKAFCKKNDWKYWGVNTYLYAWSDELAKFICGAVFYCHLDNKPFLLYECNYYLLTKDDILKNEDV